VGTSERLLFSAAITASALHRLWPSPFTRWQRRNRRYLGRVPRPHREMNPLPGLIAYALLVAMTVTSFDHTAAWIGRRAWNVLHTVGSIYLWGAFLNAFVVRARHAPGYWLPVALTVVAMVLRVVAWAWRRRRR
jgi:hypothetical protein